MAAPARASLMNVMYSTGAGQVPDHHPPPVLGAVAVAGPVIHRNEHILYTAADTRVMSNVAPVGGLAHHHSISSVQNVAGDTLYLKFFADRISSLRLPDPPPVGVTFFYTDNLSGCRIFVDRVTGSNDIVVYHANTTQHTAGHLNWANHQTAGADAILIALHTNAVLDYGIPLAAVAGSTLGMSRYFREARNEEQRKFNQGRRATAHDAPGRVIPGLAAPPDRTRPLFYGGCFVCGYYNAGWRLYFQAWGAVSYSRPAGGLLQRADFKGLIKKIKHGDRQVQYADMRVMERARFFP